MRSASSAHELELVLDENLSGRSIFEGLKNLDIPVKLQTDLMKRGISDQEVLEILAKHPNCCLISKDADFHRKPAVREALKKHGIGAFIITTHKGKTGAQLVTIISSAWTRIQKFLKNNKKPFVAKIIFNGKVEKVI